MCYTDESDKQSMWGGGDLNKRRGDFEHNTNAKLFLKPLMFACPLVHKFRTSNKTVKLKGMYNCILILYQL